MIHKHLNKKYITIDDYCQDLGMNYTFRAILKKDKSLTTNYCDDKGIEVYELSKLKYRIDKISKKYNPEGYIKLNDFHEKSPGFIGSLATYKPQRIVLPLYKSNGKKLKSKQWIMYKKIELIKAFKKWN